jgi:hypothetical protein
MTGKDNVLESLLDEIEESHKDVFAGLVWAWLLATNMWRLGDDALLDRIPGPVEIEIHQRFLNDLLSLGRFFAPRLRTLDPDDLAQFGLRRDGLLAIFAELEELAEERKEIL